MIATYDRARAVARSLESAFAQTFRDCETIVVDDGSTDDTRNLIRQYRDRVRYVYQDNRGAAAALNRGAALARGSLIAILDSDDTWHPDKLALQVAAMKRFGAGCGLSFTNARAVGVSDTPASFFERCGFDPGGDVVEFEDALALAMRGRHPILQPTMMIRRDVLLAAGGFDETMRTGYDTDLIFRLALRTRFCCVNRVLTYYDVSPGRGATTEDLTRADPLIRLKAEERMYGKLLAEVDGRYPGYQREVRRRLGAVFAQEGKHFLRLGQPAAARRAYGRAVTVDPSLRNLAKCALANLVPSMLVGR